MDRVARQSPFGSLLRTCRKRRRFSQLELALDAEISTKHLSFLEVGHSQPSREMVLKLSQSLKLSLRAQNALLTAAGFSALYPQRQLEHPELKSALHAINLVLTSLEPYPSIALDKYWDVQAANSAVPLLLEGIPADLLSAPLNVMRLSLNPLGLRRRIGNLPEWSAHLLHLLRNQIDLDNDSRLVELQKEMLSYESSTRRNRHGINTERVFVKNVPFIPLELHVGDDLLTMISTTMVFGTPTDVTLSELMVETLLPADTATADWFKRRARR